MAREVDVDHPEHMQPTEVGDVRDRVVIAGQPGTLGQTCIEDREDVFGKVPVALDRRQIALLREVFEMHALAEDGTDAGGVEHQPGDGVPARGWRLWQQCAALLGQVQQDRRRFKQHDASAAVFEDRNATVRIEPQEIRMAMFTLLDAHVVQAIRQAQLLQRDGGLVAVG